MKKILLITLFAAFVLSSCKKETTSGVSRITTFPVISLKGAATIFWTMNTPFVDPGSIAKEGTTDISTKITVSSNVDITKGGKYSMTYKVLNADGFPATISRTVYVYDGTSTLNGYYTSSISRTNTSTNAVSARGPYTILVLGVGSSNVWVEDLMGGWYYYGSGYGYGYAGTAVLKINADNTLSIVKSNATSFGGSSACVFNAVSTYNPATKTFLIHSNMGDTPNLVFNVTMNNPTPFI